MANEFIVKNGLISQNNSTISGSLIVTNGITGSILGTATSASYVNSLHQAVMITGSLIVSGSTNPSLIVSGNVNIQVANNGNGPTLYIGPGSSNSGVGILTSGTAYDYIGIPSYNTYLSPGVIYIFAASNIAGYTQANGDFQFRNSTTNLMYLSNNAKLGINTISPSAQLHVHGAGATSGTNALYIENSTPTNLLTVRNDGNVGIGTSSPATLLHVSGTTRIDNAGSTPSTSPAGPPANMYYGSGGNNYLSDPSVWLKINVGGTDYVFPGY
jgi:hypothetical protein